MYACRAILRACIAGSPAEAWPCRRAALQRRMHASVPCAAADCNCRRAPAPPLICDGSAQDDLPVLHVGRPHRKCAPPLICSERATSLSVCLLVGWFGTPNGWQPSLPACAPVGCGAHYCSREPNRAVACVCANPCARSQRECGGVEERMRAHRHCLAGCGPLAACAGRARAGMQMAGEASIRSPARCALTACASCVRPHDARTRARPTD